MERERDPVVAICGVVAARFGEADRRAAPGSPLALARTRLGARYAGVTAAALQARTIAALTGAGAAEALEAVAACGELGALSVVVGIVADALADILADILAAP